MEHSTAASIFWKPDEMKEMATELAAVGMHADLKLHLQVDDQNRGLCKT